MKITDRKVILFLLLMISAISHAVNMFGFPYYENDEGVYMSQAWSLLTQGKLSPYTYWYDHAPVGWMLIALWVKLSGGFFTFGPAINSGRVLMLIIHLATTYLIWYIAGKLTKNSLVASTLAVFVYSLSPLGIYFQRRVLLDNIMIFWVFFSIALLLKKNLKLTRVVLSAISFGIAVLVKENAIFFAPAFIYLLYKNPNSHNRGFALAGWLITSAFTVSMYFLYAILKTEFFPPELLSISDRSSLINTLQYQLTRGDNLPFWRKNSGFYSNLSWWISLDAYIIILGIFSTITNIILGIRIKSLRIVSILAVLFWIFLMRGGLIINFYIIPLLPIIALNLGILADYVIKKITSNGSIIAYILATTIMTLPIPIILSSREIFTKDETTVYITAANWIKENVPKESHIVIDNALYLDLLEYPHADWFWKVEKDSQIREKKLNNNWRNIDYIVVSHEMLKQINESSLSFLDEALDNSYRLIEWKKDSSSYIDVQKRLSTNGDWLAIYKVNEESRQVLQDSWEYYKENFIISYGQVIDPSNHKTTSEGQAYAMLRAVWMDDRQAFDGIWSWTKHHLQHRKHDKLISWLWGKSGKEFKLLDSSTAADADCDIALALILASSRFNNTAYLNEARVVINDIWKKEVIKVGDRYILTMGPDSKRENGYLVNPSYFSPAHFRLFSRLDKNHDWIKLANDSYYFLNKMKLPRNWILINESSGKLFKATKYINSDADHFGFDAFRIFWRVALDYQWFDNPRALVYLKRFEKFYADEWENHNNFAAIYSADGKRVSDYSSLSTSSGALSLFSVIDQDKASEIYLKLFKGNHNSLNYYDQNWAWFSTALYYDLLPRSFSIRSE